MSTKPTLAYWNIRGLAQPIRLVLVYAGVDFVDKRYESSERAVWLSDKPNLGLDFPNIPYYIDGDLKISQSMAILKYLARKHGLVARDDRELIKQEIVAEQLSDIVNSFCLAVTILLTLLFAFVLLRRTQVRVQIDFGELGDKIGQNESVRIVRIQVGTAHFGKI